MQTLGGLLVSPVLAFYQRFLRLTLRFFLLMFMDFPSTFRIITKFSELGCGFLLLGYVSPLFNFLGLLLIFLFCLRVLRVAKNGAADSGCNSEDQVFDVMSLRRMVKAERQRYNAACAEIEKERGAAASAAEEAMAMILRLQSEKSAVEIQAKQFRRVVEQRQEYDQEVMESLRWTAEQVESQKNLLERQLEALRERLAQFLNEHEIEHLREQEEERIEEEEEERIAEEEEERIAEEEEEVRIAEEEEVVRIAEEEEEVRIAEEERIEEEEEGGGGGGGVEEEEEEGTATRTASVIGDDDDSSGFLNFSVELDVEVSSQTQSPTCIRTEQDHLFQDMNRESLLVLQSCQISQLIWNAARCGNGASIVTTSSAAATKFQTEVEVGQVGINVPISVSLPFSSSISSRPSFVGDLNFDGRARIQFYTPIKRGVAKLWTDTLDGYKAILEIPFTWKL